MGIWLCNHLPWHRFVVRKPLSRDAERLTCSCGRNYAINHHVRTILPWEDVRSFYESSALSHLRTEPASPEQSQEADRG